MTIINNINIFSVIVMNHINFHHLFDKYIKDAPVSSSADKLKPNNLGLIKLIQIKLVDKINDGELNSILPILYPQDQVHKLLASTSLITGKFVSIAKYEHSYRKAIHEVKKDIVDKIDSLKYLANKQDVEQKIATYFDKLDIDCEFIEDNLLKSEKFILKPKISNEVSSFVATSPHTSKPIEDKKVGSMFAVSPEKPQKQLSLIDDSLFESQVKGLVDSHIIGWGFDNHHVITDYTF